MDAEALSPTTAVAAETATTADADATTTAADAAITTAAAAADRNSKKTAGFPAVFIYMRRTGTFRTCPHKDGAWIGSSTVIVQFFQFLIQRKKQDY